ncbi:hypothetical protein DRW03_07245 [Corallococcus sp. H22C18031201]|uniref:hypothetical protein n=1 Tax=Citreicoccus inhibens TaxID=2849499 RepID=UPI000E740E38|nr:hypothetical protein [Citreicoccus inhibens]MBU8897811.1 outer membrane protein assembly factor BamE [Citreicoccus inhibens]RJS24923.1 hypothetical protein DRW03_07245 [Corallococcus sp. H22C18031201]
MRTPRLTTVCALALMGCASAGGFDKLYPGMTAAQVAETMGRGPTQAEPFAEGWAAWYYGEDRCVLMRDDKLVGKSVTEERAALNTPVISVRDTVRAQCLPPGLAGKSAHQQEIDTPFGTIKGNIDPATLSTRSKRLVTPEETPKPAEAQAPAPTP